MLKTNYYVVVIKQLANDNMERTITEYNDKDTARRKFHEAFNVIGGGPKRITSMLIEDSISEMYDKVPNIQGNLDIIKVYNSNVIAQETWVDEAELELLET